MALYDCALASLINVAQTALWTEKPSKRLGNAHPNIAPYDTLPTADGSLVVTIGDDRYFKALCQTINRPSLASDPRFCSNPKRVENRAILIPEIVSVFVKDTTENWNKKLENAGIPNAPVCNPIDALNSKQSSWRGLVTKDSLGRKILASPIRINDLKPELRLDPGHQVETTEFWS